MGYDETMCSDIDNCTQEENNLQEQVISLTLNQITRLFQVASFNMKLSMLDAFPSILLALLVGPWSDRCPHSSRHSIWIFLRNGRKPVMLLPMLGFILSKSVMIANIFYWVTGIVTVIFSVPIIRKRQQITY